VENESTHKTNMIRPWQKISSKPLGQFRIFDIRSEQRLSPRTNEPHEFVVIDCVNWVNVIALTSARELIMIEQFRHGTNTVELEIPGGTMEQGEASPVQTAVRELREETGYEGENARMIGEIFPNPAIMSNTCYTVLVENCQLKHPLQMDSGEDLITRVVPVQQVPELVMKGRIRHSLVVVALYYFELWQRQHPPL
jgi:ADP-ribose pyrophosphatase